MSVTQVGIFKSNKAFDRRQLPVMRRLEHYYTSERIKSVLLPMISETNKGKLSLRALDWLVTNYAKKRPVVYKVKLPRMSEKFINVHSEYKTWLWKYKRCHFDPFRRWTPLYFDLDGETYKTTVGQLNFMFWASRYGVIEYARNHIGDIEKDHATTIKTKRGDGKKRKRRQLSERPSKKVLVFGGSVKMTFNPEGETE